jgi:ketosteroid isomerase-like protein
MPTVAEDRDAIRDLFARYASDIDAGADRAEAWSLHYAEDGRFDPGGGMEPVAGREALRAYCLTMPTSGVRHALANLVIDVAGDVATCEAIVIVIVKGRIVSTGVAQDELHRIDGRWQIVRRVFTPDPS